MTPVPISFSSVPGSGVVRGIKPCHGSLPAFLFDGVFAVCPGLCDQKTSFGPYLLVGMKPGLFRTCTWDRTSLVCVVFIHVFAFGLVQGRFPSDQVFLRSGSAPLRSGTWDRTSLSQISSLADSILYMGPYLPVGFGEAHWVFAASFFVPSLPCICSIASVNLFVNSQNDQTFI